jgi:hypothetical protein
VDLLGPDRPEARGLGPRRQAGHAPGANQSRLLEREADAGLVGICAAAFALEAISRELDELGMVSAATRAAWRKNRLSDHKQILELVKLAVDPTGLADVWKRELAWLFAVRGSPVYYRGPSSAAAPPAWNERRAIADHLLGGEHYAGGRAAAGHPEAVPGQASAWIHRSANGLLVS